MKSERKDISISGTIREPALLAHKAGIGGILFHEDSSTYELRLEMEQCKNSYFMTAKEWEDFIQFSGQDERKEFFMLVDLAVDLVCLSYCPMQDRRCSVRRL